MGTELSKYEDEWLNKEIIATLESNTKGMVGKHVNHAFSVQLDGVYRKDGVGVNTFLQIIKL